MKDMKKKLIKTILAVCAFPLALTSCEVFGLELQKPYDFDYNAGVADNHVHMSTYEFIGSRTDIFSKLKEAIDYAGLEDLYKQGGCTYILPTNAAFDPESSNSYVSRNKLSYYDEEGDSIAYYSPTSLTMYPKEQIKEFLLYHIVKGEYTFTNLPAEPTWYDTYATADTAKVNMYVYKDRNPNITFNNFDGHYLNSIKPRTANLYSNEGSYIHVLDNWLDRPTKGQINLE